MVVMIVTITRIVVVAQKEVCPSERGPSWRYSNAGGDSAALRYRQGVNRGLQGLRFALRQGCELNSHPSSQKRPSLARLVLEAVAGDFDAKNRLNGRRVIGPKRRVSVQWTPFVTQSYDFGAVMSIL